MKETLVEALRAVMPLELVVVVVAMIPIIELRGAIPIGVGMLGLPAWETFLLAMLGNLLPVPILLLVLNPLRKWVSHWPVVGPILRWAEARANKRKHQIEKHGVWGLIAFVGVPLPGTGAWTGSFVAVLLGIPFWKAWAAISIGVLAAGVIIGTLAAAGLRALGA